MDWLGKLLDTVLGGMPTAAVALCPDHLKKKWLERLADHNPFKTISANHDLVRATRLAWIEVAQEVLKEARACSTGDEWRGSAADISAFDASIDDILLDARDHALDRRRNPGFSPIDAHVQSVIAGVPELVSPGEHVGIGGRVTAAFTSTLGGLSGWDAGEVPAIYQQIADTGLPTHGGGPPRRFGELVFAAFAEIIKDPQKYPQAREAFHIAMDKLGRDIGQSTLDTVKGFDGKLDVLVEGLDALKVLRKGAIRYLELLPQIREDTAATRAGVEELLRRTAQTEGVPLDALRAILGDMGELADTLDAAQVGEKLKAKATEFKALTDRLNRLSNDDPQVFRLRQEAATALEAGKFAQADAHLAAAEARDLDGLEDLEALARQKRLSAAESRSERAAAAKLRSNPAGYREAASHFGEAARIAEAADPETSRGYKVQEGLVLIELGTDFGLNSALHEAVEHFRVLVQGISRNVEPLAWAAMQSFLGRALRMLGKRESGTARLEEAVAAYRAALEELTRERTPFVWAEMQNSLGNALQTLGERESGTERLEEAVAAYRAALEEQTRERLPLAWAAAQSNLGDALRTLGDRENKASWLEEAVAAFRAALEELTRERTPLAWAATQNSLGNALVTLGERESGTERLEEAVAAIRAALEEQTRERVPLAWAVTHSNLGNALVALGERESGTARLEEAVAAYRAALEEQTRERAPLDWAKTHSNLGVALRTLGERESGTARLEEAVAAYRAALEEQTRERVPLAWAATQNSLGNTLVALGERESGTARLEEAVATFRAALEKLARERVPLAWAVTQCNLGNALALLGERENQAARLEEAIAAYRAALEEQSRERTPLAWASTLANEGEALQIIAARTKDLALAEQALEIIERAGSTFEASGHAVNAVYCSEKADLARALIRELRDMR
jgi:tetratricopeptide (TPR) repeat protein